LTHFAENFIVGLITFFLQKPNHKFFPSQKLIERFLYREIKKILVEKAVILTTDKVLVSSDSYELCRHNSQPNKRQPLWFSLIISLVPSLKPSSEA